MRLILVQTHDDDWATPMIDQLQFQGFDVEIFKSSAFLGALSSIGLRKALKDAGNDTVVLARTSSHAMTALQARNLLGSSNVKIVMMPKPNQEAPRRIASDILKGVDAWIFSSKRQIQEYAGITKNIHVQPLPYSSDLQLKEESHGEAPLRLLWIGSIDGNTARLRNTIEAIDKAPCDATLVICGTGKAGNTMPAVQQSRAMLHPKRVEWKGEDFDLSSELALACGIAQAGLDPTAEELMAANKIAYKEHPCISDFHYAPNEGSADECFKALREILNSL